MIVVLSTTGPPSLIDVDRLDRLHVECAGHLHEMQFGELCRPGPDDEHVWLSVPTLRSIGEAQSDDESFVVDFDGMIASARAKGWSSDDGNLVRAHVERRA